MAQIEGEPFDLVLIQMPELDGLEATLVIREKEESTGAHLPIVATTAHAMRGDQERCLAAGMDGYVSKPLSGPALANEIDRVRTTSFPGRPEPILTPEGRQ
jgi:CheY-like chemotaxis protein